MLTYLYTTALLVCGSYNTLYVANRKANSFCIFHMDKLIKSYGSSYTLCQVGMITWVSRNTILMGVDQLPIIGLLMVL